MKKKLAAGIFAAVFFTMFATVTVWAEKSTVLEQVIYDENNIKVSVSEASLDAEQNIVIPLHNDSKVICKTDDFVIGYGGADKK